jgi:tRNA pseudouridine55 synthase
VTTGLVDFVVLVDKPEGPTSHDIVAAARRGIGTRRVGHTGTLDPFASGLLLLCIGRATRLAEYLSGLDKSYEAVARLGIATDTLDRDGEVVLESEAWVDCDDARIAEALQLFEGEIEQIPPQYSAKKVDGEAMHRRARRGERIELPPSTVTVHRVALLSVDLPDVRFSVRCSSGTYIRSIARDLGEALGVGAHLTALRRTSVGTFDVASAIDVDALSDRSRVAEVAVAPLDAVGHLRTIEIDAKIATRVTHGQKIRLDGQADDGLVAVSCGGALYAIAEVDDGVLKPRKVFAA